MDFGRGNCIMHWRGSRVRKRTDGKRRTKFPTKTQYTNCSAPTTTRNAMNVSSSFTRCGVFLTYFPHTPCNMSCALFWDLEAGFKADFAGVDVVVDAAAGVRGFGAMLAVVVWIEGGG